MKLKSLFASLRSRTALSTLLALVMLLLLVALVHLRHGAQPMPDKMLIRQLEVAQLAIPPSPPQTQQSAAALTSPQLQLPQAKSETQLAINPLPVKLTESSLMMPALAIDLGESLQAGMSQQQLLNEMQTYNLNQLDDYPRLLNMINAKLPADIAAQGINELQLVMHVIIHETGRVQLLELEPLPYQQLEPLAEQIAKQAHFTAPLYQGEKVKAEFFWPVKVKA